MLYAKCMPHYTCIYYVIGQGHQYVSFYDDLLFYLLLQVICIHLKSFPYDNILMALIRVLINSNDDFEDY